MNAQCFCAFDKLFFLFTFLLNFFEICSDCVVTILLDCSLSLTLFIIYYLLLFVYIVLLICI